MAALAAEVEEFTRRLAETEALIRRLRDSEDPASGVVHARAIFDATQEKHRLGVEIQVRRNRINRLRAGGYGETAVSPGLKKGFLF